MRFVHPPKVQPQPATTPLSPWNSKPRGFCDRKRKGVKRVKAEKKEGQQELGPDLFDPGQRPQGATEASSSPLLLALCEQPPDQPWIPVVQVCVVLDWSLSGFLRQQHHLQRRGHPWRMR